MQVAIPDMVLVQVNIMVRQRLNQFKIYGGAVISGIKTIYSVKKVRNCYSNRLSLVRSNTALKIFSSTASNGNSRRA